MLSNEIAATAAVLAANGTPATGATTSSRAAVVTPLVVGDVQGLVEELRARRGEVLRRVDAEIVEVEERLAALKQLRTQVVSEGAPAASGVVRVPAAPVAKVAKPVKVTAPSKESGPKAASPLDVLRDPECSYATAVVAVATVTPGAHFDVVMETLRGSGVPRFKKVTKEQIQNAVTYLIRKGRILYKERCVHLVK